MKSVGRMRCLQRIGLVAVLLCSLQLIVADEHQHSYRTGDKVWVWVNKVGPHSNPHETYPFYSLFQGCEPKSVEERPSSLGEVIEGNSVIKSHISFPFRRNTKGIQVCEMTPTKAQVEALAAAVQERYWFEMYIDDMPVWGQVGSIYSGNKASSSRADDGESEGNTRKDPAVFTHLIFHVMYNQNQIVGVNVTGTEPVALGAGRSLIFKVTTRWVPSTVEFDRRFDSYLEPRFFEHRVHWFALANGFMMALFLAAVVAILLSRAAHRDEEDAKIADDEAGWKRLSGMVFRVPPQVGLFAALLGTGGHILSMLGGVLIAALATEFHTYRGGFTSAIIGSYLGTSFFGGIVSGAYYKRCEGPTWIRTMLLTVSLLPGLVATIVLCITLVAWAYGALAALPFVTMLQLLVMWLFIAVPLAFVGTIVGRNLCGTAAPSRNQMPRPVPVGSWYSQRSTLVALGGLLPFGAAFVETYFVFAALWHYKLYYVYGFAALALVCVMAVAACSASVAIFVQLCAEDHQWQWTAFGAGASTGLYIFGYAVYYFVWRTRMSGLLQTLYFFGYSAMLCVVLGVLCGTIAYGASTLFVRRLYANIKDE